MLCMINLLIEDFAHGSFLAPCFLGYVSLTLTLTSHTPHKHNTNISSLLLNTLLTQLQCLAAAMIIFTFVDQGRINSLWGLFVAGCILGGAAILGFITGFTLRPGFKGLVCLLTYLTSLFSLFFSLLFSLLFSRTTRI